MEQFDVAVVGAGVAGARGGWRAAAPGRILHAGDRPRPARVRAAGRRHRGRALAGRDRARPPPPGRLGADRPRARAHRSRGADRSTCWRWGPWSASSSGSATCRGRGRCARVGQGEEPRAPGFLHTADPAFSVWWSAYPTRVPLAVAWSGGPPAAASPAPSKAPSSSPAKPPPPKEGSARSKARSRAGCGRRSRPRRRWGAAERDQAAQRPAYCSAARLTAVDGTPKCWPISRREKCPDR